MTTICKICIEDRDVITCTNCDLSACSDCNLKYMEKNQVVCCMGCFTPWDRVWFHMNMRLGATFYEKHIKRIQGKILLTEEKKHLPSCQGLARDEITIQLLEEQWKKGRRKNKDMKNEINTLRKVLDNKMGVFHEQKKKGIATEVICQCTDEKCNGFVTKQGKCGMCDMKVCKKCHEEIKDGSDHVCDEDTVKSIQNIKNNTKPCPNCKVFIHKIEGCDHMWCTICNTAWEWSTGKQMESKDSTNPHYYMWRMTQQDYSTIDNANVIDLCINILYDKRMYRTFTDLFHIFTHVESIIIPELQNGVVLPNPIPYRVRYLSRSVNDEQWLSHLMKATKKTERFAHEIKILQKWCNTQRDILQTHIIESIHNAINQDRIIILSQDSINKCNEELSDIAYMFKSKALVFNSEKWRIYRDV